MQILCKMTHRLISTYSWGSPLSTSFLHYFFLINWRLYSCVTLQFKAFAQKTCKELVKYVLLWIKPKRFFSSSCQQKGNKAHARLCSGAFLVCKQHLPGGIAHKTFVSHFLIWPQQTPCNMLIVNLQMLQLFVQSQASRSPHCFWSSSAKLSYPF